MIDGSGSIASWAIACMPTPMTSASTTGIRGRFLGLDLKSRVMRSATQAEAVPDGLSICRSPRKKEIKE
jgi:hypothetical protein